MCGICGVTGIDARSRLSWVQDMTRALAHRGPDDEGVLALESAVLGNRRLAIQDLSSAGHQPMGDEALGMWITFNGEIYNHAELRRELEASGARFSGRSDTEVLLRLYHRHGAECLHRLRGMFAFAIWDQRRRILFAARDHFGQKPFFFAEVGRGLAFASEIKALLKHPGVDHEPEPAAIDHYLALRLIPAPLTMFRGIRKLPPAHWLEWSEEGGLRTGSYWTPPVSGGARLDDAEWIERVKGALEDSVATHRTGDVRIGAFLSGGLDSSVVVALLTRSGEARLPTFCIGSDSSVFDERPHARVMADHCGTEHHEEVVSVDLLGRIPHLVAALDEPSDPIAACFDAAARLASRHVKVVLGGDGGDEMFAGFDRYAAFGMASRYARLPRWLREGVLRRSIRWGPEGFGYKTLSQKARWLDDVSSEQGGRLYARMTSHFRFGPERRSGLYGPGLAEAVTSVDPLAAIAEPFDSDPRLAVLDRMLRADLATRLPEHTLMLADRLGMAHGLEVRSPLLDVRLSEVCLAMPPHLRSRGGRTKIGLRRAAEDWLPPSLLRRRKQGFMFPVADWLDARTLRGVSSHLQNGPLVHERWIRPEAIDALAGEHATRRADHHVRLWQLVSLDSWHRHYVQHLDVESQSEQLLHAIERVAGVDAGPSWRSR